MSQGYSTQVSRTEVDVQKTMLKVVDSKRIFPKFTKSFIIGKNKTDTASWRRRVPLTAVSSNTPGVDANGRSVANEVPNINPQNFLLQEFQTPDNQSWTWSNVQETLQYYGVLYSMSLRAQEMYQDDYIKEMQSELAERLSEILEVVDYNKFKAGTAVVYSTGSSRAAINAELGSDTLYKAIRVLQANRAEKITEMVKSDVRYGTMPVPASFVAFGHTDLYRTFMKIPGFHPKETYGGSMEPLHIDEVGSFNGGLRVILSDVYKPFLGAGSATLNGMISNGTNVDVYPVLVMGREAWGTVALKGYEAVKPVILPADVITHGNPLGSRGYVGIRTCYASTRLNDNHCVRIETGAMA